MNQKKMGMFIKQLRKEKNLTQEQLAEHLNVSNRTVSRWETGSNIPDLDILITLAGYFEIDIKELIDGGRMDRKLDDEQRETLQKIADYSNCKEQILIKKIHGIIISGIFAWGISFILMLSFAQAANGVGILLTFEVVAFLLYSCCMFIVNANRSTSGYMSSLIEAFSAVILSNLILLFVFFRTGSYYNHGIIGVYYALLTYAISFIISGVTISIINKKREKQSDK